MMKLAYLVTLDVSKESGVLKKIISQAKAWASAGHNVRIFALSSQGSIWDGFQLSGIPFDVFAANSLLGKFSFWQRLVGAITEWCPSVVYYRAGLYYPGFNMITQHFPVVAEINTSDLDEYRIVASRSKYIYHRMTRRRLFASCMGLVCVTRELAQRYAGFGKPVAVIANGIDLAAYTPLPPTDNRAPRFVFLGSPGFAWHGVDKILTLAELCPDFTFDFDWNLRGAGKITGTLQLMQDSYELGK